MRRHALGIPIKGIKRGRGEGKGEDLQVSVNLEKLVHMLALAALVPVSGMR